MKAVHLLIEGRVQGVGFRAWVKSQARRRGLTGYVRNRWDGSVEAVLCGEDAVVDDVTIACDHGPRLAAVHKVTREPATPESWSGFSVWPTA